jgi:uncharacterized protein YjbI with pentapeptide repeats
LGLRVERGDPTSRARERTRASGPSYKGAVSGNSIDHDATAQAIFAVVRRETFALAVSVRTEDIDGAVIAAARLRWALAAAEQVVGLSDAEGRARRAARLDTLRHLASHWLDVAELCELPSLTAEAVCRFLGHIQTRAGEVEPRIDAANISLEELELDELDLRGASLRGTTLADLTARSSRLDAADLSRARILRCELQGSALARATLNDCELEQSTLWGADLECASLLGASVARCGLRDAALSDAWLDGAMFTDCDLRGADLRVTREGRRNSKPTSFVRCDLRDTYWHGRELERTSFIDCKLHGARGDSFARWPFFERSDLSRAANGSRIGTAFEVAMAWGAPRDKTN